MEQNYTVYKHICPNGKIYVGCTRQDPCKRWDNGYSYSKNKIFYADILFYGWKNIKHEIIATNLKRNEAFLLEHKLIVECESNKPEKGYNISNGFGRSGVGHKHSEETRKKISERVKGKHSLGLHPLARAVYCVELNKTYSCGVLAEKETGVNKAHICQVCKGQRKTAGGYHWQYVEQKET